MCAAGEKRKTSWRGPRGLLYAQRTEKIRNRVNYTHNMRVQLMAELCGIKREYGPFQSDGLQLIFPFRVNARARSLIFFLITKFLLYNS